MFIVQPQNQISQVLAMNSSTWYMRLFQQLMVPTRTKIQKYKTIKEYIVSKYNYAVIERTIIISNDSSKFGRDLPIINVTASIIHA